MSGIAVLFNLDGRPADPALVGRMLEAIPYRGCDGMGRTADGPVAMGHAMLRSTPESLDEIQPLRDESDELCLTMDGRVDNRRELGRAIEAKGVHLRTDTDAELVLRAWQCWGEESPARIIGDFAYAIWDGRRRELFCARDPMGVKTFFYHIDARRFLCASELHQILEDGHIRREPNEEFIAELMVRLPYDRGATIFRGILRLPPSHSMTVGAEGITLRQYFDLDPMSEIRCRDDGEYAERFLEVFSEAVRCRLRSSGPVGADLSGGLDSSSIVSTAQSLFRDGRAKDRGFETFSVMYDGGPADERSYVRDVVRKWHPRATFLEPVAADVSRSVEQVRHYKDLPDHPTMAGADYAGVFRDHHPFRVWLTGSGGGFAAGGSRYCYADFVRRLKFRRLFNSIRRDYSTWPAYSGQPHPVTRFLRYGLWPFVPAGARDLVRRRFGREVAAFPLTEEFAGRTRLRERLLERQEAPRCREFAREDVYRSFSGGWKTYAGEMGERWCASHSVEGRHPFHDRRLIEFCFAIPEDQRCRDGQGKYVMRQAMRGILPESVRWRTTKASFSSLLPEAIEAAGGEGIFANLAIGEAGWVGRSSIQSAYHEMMRLYRRGDENYWNYLHPLWMVFAVELWMNSVILGRRPGFLETGGRRSPLHVDGT